MIPKEVLLIIAGLGVAVVLVGIWFFFFGGKEKKKTKKEKSESVEAPKPTNESLRGLIEIVENPNSRLADLEEALDRMESEVIFSGDAERELYFVYCLARHPRVNAKLIVQMDKKLKRKNPKYEKLIDKYEQMGLNERK